MKVLFDTNVILDALIDRNDLFSTSRFLINCVVDEKIKGYISSKQVTDIYYILRKYYDGDKRKKLLKLIFETFEVLPLLPSFASYCVNSKIQDYEDAILDETAKINMIPYIVTNNLKDFENSKSAVISPKDLYTLIEVTNP